VAPGHGGRRRLRAHGRPLTTTPADAPRPGEPRIAPIVTERPTLNLFATLRHNRALATGFFALGEHLLQGGEIPARDRELVILRVGWRCGAEYEFSHHRSIALDAGVTAAEIDRVADVDLGAWSVEDAPLIALADELCATTSVSDAAWQALASRFDDAAMLELMMLAGFYRMVSGVLNGARVALESGQPGWPDGATPARHAPRE
jgi:4-carboxymuconolactone decarboxylase